MDLPLREVILMKKSSTIKLTYFALLVAISTLLNSVTILPTFDFAIALTPTIAFLSGMMFGGIGGFCVGFLGDFLGAVLAPKGPYLILIGISSGLMGLIPGLIVKHTKMPMTIKVIISFILCYIFVTAGLNSYAIYKAYIKSQTFFVYASGRVVTQFPNCLLNLAITIALVRVPTVMQLFQWDKKKEKKKEENHKKLTVEN